MNLKKYLRLKPQEDTESLLSEEDELFIQQLAKTYNIKDNKENVEVKKGKKKKSAPKK